MEGQFTLSYLHKLGLWFITRHSTDEGRAVAQTHMAARSPITAVAWLMMFNGDSSPFHPLQTLKSFWAKANDLTPAAEPIAHFLLALHEPLKYRMSDSLFLQMDQQELDMAHALWDFLDVQGNPLTFWLGHLGHTVNVNRQMEMLAERWSIPAVAA
ncbi:hypothetical protein V8Z74_14655 [Comamonas sp. w2-DMI]|uniref:hypothetical protein n=1 Tax=Comamonas sp. w2-DMI TaxID=3126391 RepID=UPI0032E3DDD6